MSAKYKRRERRKLDKSRRRGSHVKAGAAALGAAAAIAAGTQAYAAPVRFDNPPGPGHFNWVPTVDGGQIYLDITEDASQQPGSSSDPSSLRQILNLTVGYASLNGVQSGMDVETFNTYLVRGLNAGQLIPSGAAFADFGVTYYAAFGSDLPEGAPRYVPFRFDLGSGLQFGWVGVVRTGLTVDAFAWGYETTPGVPIAAGAPEPGTLALLAFGALAVWRRRA